MSQPRILLADDEAYVTTTLTSKFRAAGYEVATAGDGVEGAALARTFLPSLIISDFQMPSSSGFEMAIELGKDPATAHIPIMLLTSRGHVLSPDALAQTNIRLIVSKPFSARELVNTAQQLLQQGRAA